MLNGQPTRSFVPTRGIQLDEPISLYLFVLWSKGFSALIRGASGLHLWRVILFGNNGPNLAHLVFADDILLFGKTDIEATTNLKSVNLEKSSVFFPKQVSNHDWVSLVGFLDVISEGKGKYLGLPYFIRRSKKDIFAFVRKG